MNHVDDALLQWQTAANLDPGSADIAAAMAIGLWRKGNKPDSLTSYRQAISLNRAYVCSDKALQTEGYWNAAAVDVLHDVREFAGAAVCRS